MMPEIKGGGGSRVKLNQIFNLVLYETTGLTEVKFFYRIEKNSRFAILEHFSYGHLVHFLGILLYKKGPKWAFFSPKNGSKMAKNAWNY